MHQAPPTILPRLGFVHVPKTAGTSVTNALAGIYGDQMHDAMTTLDYARCTPEQLDRARFYKGHAYRRDYEQWPAETVLFTVLRDPVARAVSFYQYYRGLTAKPDQDDFTREAVELAQGSDVIEFIYSNSPFIIEHLRVGQLRQFLTSATLAKVAHRQFLTRALQDQVVEEFLGETTRFSYVMTTDYLPLHMRKMADDLVLMDLPMILPHDNASIAAGPVSLSDVRRALVDVSGAEFTCYDHVRRMEAGILVQWSQEESSSFLKKRTKKLLLV
jgi:hypothetical protein